jgi:hypothetical protein
LKQAKRSKTNVYRLRADIDKVPALDPLAAPPNSDHEAAGLGADPKAVGHAHKSEIQELDQREAGRPFATGRARRWALWLFLAIAILIGILILSLPLTRLAWSFG